MTDGIGLIVHGQDGFALAFLLYALPRCCNMIALVSKITFVLKRERG